MNPQSIAPANTAKDHTKPGTHLNRVFVNELLRGANASGTWGEIAFMTGLGILFFCLGTKGYAHWTKKDSYLGPKL